MKVNKVISIDQVLFKSDVILAFSIKYVRDFISYGSPLNNYWIVLWESLLKIKI